MAPELDDRLRAWFECAKADAERRGLAHLEPLLDSLRRQLATLRAADWNDDAGGSLGADPPVGRGRR
jgi:hypothetical protein